MISHAKRQRENIEQFQRNEEEEEKQETEKEEKTMIGPKTNVTKQRKRNPKQVKVFKYKLTQTPKNVEKQSKKQSFKPNRPNPTVCNKHTEQEIQLVRAKLLKRLTTHNNVHMDKLNANKRFSLCGLVSHLRLSAEDKIAIIKKEKTMDMLRKHIEQLPYGSQRSQIRRFVEHHQLHTYPHEKDMEEVSSFAAQHGITPHHHFQAQMFSMFRNASRAAEDLQQTSQRVREATEEVSHDTHQLLENANGTLDRTELNFNNLLQQMQGFVEDCRRLIPDMREAAKNTMIEAITYLVKIVSFGALMYRKASTLNAVDMALLITTTWTSEIKSLGIAVVQQLIQACQAVVRQMHQRQEMQAQSGDEDHKVHKSVLVSFLGMFKHIFSSDPELHAKDFALNTGKLRGMVTILRAAENFSVYFSKIAEFLCDRISRHLYKFGTIIPRIQGHKILVGNMRQWETILNSGELQHLATNRILILKMMSMRQDLCELEQELFERQVDWQKGVFLTTVRFFKADLDRYLANVPDTLKTVIPTIRPRPVWIHVNGPPRIGKSTTVEKWMLTALMARLCPEMRYENVSNLVFMRDTMQDYWEGYYGQHVVVYDDLFQIHAATEKVQTTIAELTSVMNEGAVPLNMAFNRKGTAFFTSPIVYSSSNKDFAQLPSVNDQCLSGGQHLRQRRDFVINVSAKKCYMKDDGTGIDHNKFQQEVTQDPFTTVPEDLYHMKCFSGDGEILQMEGSMRQVVLFVAEQASLLCESRREVNNTVDNALQKFHAEYVADPTRIIEECALREYVKAPEDDYVPEQGIPLRQNQKSKAIQSAPKMRTAFSQMSSRRARRNDPRLEAQCFNGDEETPQSTEPKLAKFAIPKIVSNQVRLTFDEAYATKGEEVYLRELRDLHHRTLDWERIEEEQVIHPLDRAEQIDHDDKRAFPIQPLPSVRDSLYEPMSNARVPQPPVTDSLTMKKMYCSAAPTLSEEDLREFRLKQGRELARDAGRSEFSDRVIELIGEPSRLMTRFSAWSSNDDEQIMVQPHVDYKGKIFYNDPVEVPDRYLGDEIQRKREAKPGDIITVRREAPLWRKMLAAPIKAMGFAQSFVPIIKDQSLQRDNAEYWKKEATNLEHAVSTIQMTSWAIFLALAMVTMKRMIAAVMPFFSKKLQAQEYNQQNEVVNNQLSKHMVRLELEALDENNEFERVCVIGAIDVGNGIFVTPKHFMYRFSAVPVQRSRITVTFETRGPVIIPGENVSAAQFEDSADIAFLQIKNIQSSKRLAHHFVSKDQKPNLSACYLYGPRSVAYGEKFNHSLLTVANVALESKFVYQLPNKQSRQYSWPHIDVVSDEGYRYTGVMTVNGDCGMALCHTDEQKNAKILGFHTAGSGDGIGYSQKITREDIEAAYDYFGVDVEVQAYSLEKVPTFLERKQPLLSERLNIVGQATLVPTPIGTVQMKQTPAMHTKYTKSLMAEAIEQDLGISPNLPSAITPRKIAGEMVYPLANGIMKLSSSTNLLPDTLVEDAVFCVSAAMERNSMPIAERVILTETETINGFGAMRQIEMKTSAGWPCTSKSTSNGKLPWFECEEADNGKKTYTALHQLHSMWQDRVEAAKQGIAVPTLFVATLKDEPRAVEKVEAARTRVFQVGPIDLTLALRQYFGAFISESQSHPVTSEIAIGINPNSPDWNMLYGRLKATGTHFIAGDYKDYDSTLSLQIGKAFTTVVNNYYGDSEENRLVRDTLVTQLFSSTQVASDTVYECWQGNPSGDALTTIINCVSNMILMRVAFAQITGLSMDQFEQNVAATFYGDDHVLCVSQYAADKGFNMISLSQHFARMGMKYTTTTKDAVNLDFVEEQDLRYLQKGFRFSPEIGLVVAIADLRSVLDSLIWIRTDPTNADDMLARCNSCLLEITGLGRRTYEATRHFIRKWILFAKEDAGLIVDATKLFTFSKCMEIQYPEQQIVPATIHMNECQHSSVFRAHTSEGKGKPATKKQMRIGKKALRRMKHWMAQMDQSTDSGLDVSDDIYEIWYDPRDCTFSGGPAMTNLDSIAEEDYIRLYTFQIYENHDSDCLDYNSAIFEVSQSRFDSEPHTVRTEVLRRMVMVLDAMRAIIDNNNSPPHTSIFVEDEVKRWFTDAFFPIHCYVDLFMSMKMDLITDEHYCTNAFPQWYQFKQLFHEEPLQKRKYRYLTDEFESDYGDHTFFPQGFLNPQSEYLNAQMEEVDATTKFVEDVPRHDPGTHSGRRTMMPIQQLSFSSEENFNRPILVANFQWTAAQVEGTPVQLVTLPQQWADDFIQSKLKYWAFYRTGFKLHITINGTMQHYGRLMVTWLPQPSGIDGVYKGYDQMWTNNPVQIDANSSQTVEIEIPFTHNIEFLKTADIALAGTNQYVAVYFHVSVPLRMLAGTANSVSVTVFVTPLDLVIHGSTIQPYVAQMDQMQLDELIEKSNPVKDEAVTNTNKGLISRTVMMAGKVATNFSFIPEVGPFVAVGGYVTQAVGKMLQWFGYAVSPNLAAIAPMMQKQTQLYRSEDLPNTTVMMHDPKACLDVNYANVNDALSANSLLYYMQRPACLQAVTWTSTQIVGEIVVATNLNPFTFERPVSDALYVQLPIARIMQTATQWRGSLRFHFACIASKFHAGRLRISYDPWEFQPRTTTPAPNQYTHLMNVVWDIKQQTEIAVTIPYVHRTPWKLIGKPTQVDLREFYSLGMLRISVVNILTSSQNPINPVTIQVFVSAGDDFQIAVPNLQPFTVPFTSQMEAQMYEPQDYKADDPCTFPSLSMECLRDSKYPMLGKGKLYVNQDYSTPCTLKLVRDFTNMLSYYDQVKYVKDETMSTLLLHVRPGGINRVANGGRGCFQDFFRTCFLYWRGGIRVAVLGQSGFEMNVDTIYDLGYNTIGDDVISQEMTTGTPASLFYGVSNAQIYPMSDLTPLDVTLPYTSMAKCLLNQQWRGTAVRQFGVPRMDIRLAPNALTMSAATNSNLIVLMGGGDDFILGWQLPSPQMSSAPAEFFAQCYDDHGKMSEGCTCTALQLQNQGMLRPQHPFQLTTPSALIREITGKGGDTSHLMSEGRHKLLFAWRENTAEEDFSYYLSEDAPQGFPPNQYHYPMRQRLHKLKNSRC